MAIKPFPRNFGSLSYNEENKTAFLKAGASYMRSIFKTLKEVYPDAEFKVSKNKGGIAVSGEIYGDIRLDKQRGVLVTLTESVFSGSSSKFVFYSQIRRAYPHEANPKHLGQIVGDNQYSDVHDPIDIITNLEKLIDRAKTVEVWSEA